MQALIQELSKRFKPENATNLEAVYCLDLQDIEKRVYLQISDGQCSILTETPSGEVNSTLGCDSTLWTDILSGETTPQLAFMSGRLSIEGDMQYAIKLPSIFGL